MKIKIYTVSVTRNIGGRRKATTYKAKMTDEQARNLRMQLEFNIRDVVDYEVVADRDYPVHTFDEIEKRVRWS